jgi:hypothetical protein
MKNKTYTVVGVLADTDQRYCTTVEAATPDSAEKKIRAMQSELLIAAVFEGDLTPVDTHPYGSN